MALLPTACQNTFSDCNLTTLLHPNRSRIAWVTSAVVAALLVFLAASKLLGPPGSPGFITSLTFGTGLLALDTLILIVAIRLKEAKQPPPPTCDLFSELPAELHQLIFSNLSIAELLQITTIGSTYYAQVQEAIKVRARWYGWEGGTFEEQRTYLKGLFTELASEFGYKEIKDIEAFANEFRQEILDKLQEAGGNDYPITPQCSLTIAYSAGSKSLVQMLLHLGVNPNRNMYPFLHLAAEEGQDQFIDLFIRYKTDVNVQNYKRSTPLNYALDKNDDESKIIKSVTLLLDHGADPSIPDEKENLPLHYAAIKGFHKILTLLLNNPLAIKTINNINRSGYSPLHFTLVQRPVINTLVQRAVINESVLHTINLLIEAGADVNSQAIANKTPLYNSIECLLLEDEFTLPLLKLLLKKGANPNSKGNVGKTALHLLVKSNTKEAKEAAALLLKYKADPTITDMFGHDAFFYAQDEEMRDLLKTIENPSI